MTLIVTKSAVRWTCRCKTALILLYLFLTWDCYSETLDQMKFGAQLKAQIIQPADRKFRNIESGNLVEIGQIWAIAEDDQGFMWLGGARGVARFDGLNFKLFQADLNNPYSLPEGYITDILRTKDGQMWFASHAGLYRLDQVKEHFLKVDLPLDDATQVGAIWSLAEHTDGSIWLGLSSQGIGRYDPVNDQFTRFSQVNQTLANGEEPNAYKVLVDKSGLIWSGNEEGLSRFDPLTFSATEYKYNSSEGNLMASGTIIALAEDKLGNIWIGTTDGLCRLNRKNDKFTCYVDDPKNIYGLAGKNISDIVVDHVGQIYIVSDGGGISVYDDENDRFFQIKARSNSLGSLKSNSTRRAYISDAGDLWIGYHPYGISVADRYASAFKTFVNNPSDPNSISSNTINAMVQVKPGELWLGTESGVNHIDLHTEQVTRYPHIPGEPNSLSANPALTVLVDSSGRLWAGTWGGGLNRYDFDQKKYTHIRNIIGDNQSLPSDRVWMLKERDRDSLWVGTEKGLSIYRIGQNSFEPIPGFNHRVGNLYFYRHDQLLVIDDNHMRLLDVNSLKIKDIPSWQDLPRVTNAYVTPTGELWANTERGFYHQKNIDDKPQNFAAAGDLALQYYSQIIMDQDGVLWLGNSHGLTSFEEKNMRFSVYRSEHGLPGDSFRVPRASLILYDGRVAMGGSEGLVIFNSGNVYQEEVPAMPAIIGLRVLDHKVTVDEMNSPLVAAINLAKQITLTYEQNVFSLEYTALDYQLARKASFSFQLKGFDSVWRNVGQQRVATYTNLDPGRYKFQVKAANDQGVWSKAVASIDILVLPPWWRTWKAYVLYLLGFLVVISLFLYGFWSRHQREHERRLNAKLKELDRLKDDFMAKTSHELRTPLNGIIGLTEAILSGTSGPLSTAAKEKLRVVVSSGKRLSNIINDILDFSKLRGHEIVLNFTPVDISQLIDSIMLLSEPLIGNKSVKLVNNVPAVIGKVVVDEQRLTQILFNLIGNAIKFTQRGTVSVSAKVSAEKLIIVVADTGIGINKQDQARIFQPFEQSLSDNPISHFGTGLGLTVTKQLIELHGGDIRVKSNLGEGSVFSISLPLSADQSVFIAQECQAGNALEVQDKAEVLSVDLAISSCSIAGQDKRPKILIVDDEPVNRLVLESYLGHQHFEITECASGAEALELIRGPCRFDLVLLDVMMPVLSGYEVCRQIRSMYSVCDLPVIFLTAKSQVEDMQQAYEVGANDFLYKPVLREEFLAKVRLHLRIVESFSGHFEYQNQLSRK